MINYLATTNAALKPSTLAYVSLDQNMYGKTT